MRLFGIVLVEFGVRPRASGENFRGSRYGPGGANYVWAWSVRISLGARSYIGSLRTLLLGNRGIWNFLNIGMLRLKIKYALRDAEGICTKCHRIFRNRDLNYRTPIDGIARNWPTRGARFSLRIPPRT